jgi:putative Mn2+ efflux pump MntP
MRTSIVKAYIGITLIVAAILVSFSVMGNSVTLETCGYALLISAIATAVVMLIWYVVGMWICEPIARFFTKAFEVMGRY